MTGGLKAEGRMPKGQVYMFAVLMLNVHVKLGKITVVSVAGKCALLT